MSLESFKKPGKASFVLGGQFGSEAKGAACAFLATHLTGRREMFDIVTTNNGAQSGHVSVHNGVKKTTFNLPTASLYPYFKEDWDRIPVQPLTYLNAGAVIDPDVLLRELDENPSVLRNFAIHPNAAVITQDCKDAEMREDSAQTKIASTRKGVGEALSRKVLRSGMLAKDFLPGGDTRNVSSGVAQILGHHVRRVDLNEAMMRGLSVLIEIPQGHSLSLDGPFYPHTTSRNCTVMQAMSDAGIHPNFYYQSMLVIKTFPIRVGNISITTYPHLTWQGEDQGHNVQLGYSGDHFPDQSEITWADLGVQAEITTVTKRVRRVFTFSEQQVAEAIAATRPSVIFLSFCDYVPERALVRMMVEKLKGLSRKHGLRNGCPEILCGFGPSTSDVIKGEDV